MGIWFWIIWLRVFQNVYTLMDCDLFRYVQVGVWDIASSVEGLLVIPLRVGSFLAGESHLRREIFKRWRVKVVIRETYFKWARRKARRKLINIIFLITMAKVLLVYFRSSKQHFFIIKGSWVNLGLSMSRVSIVIIMWEKHIVYSSVRIAWGLCGIIIILI